MIQIIFFGVLVHLFFLASIFVIYFQSPVIVGLAPQQDLTDAPAKRLVLFVADGLRAESFYRDGCKRTKFLQNIILKNGMHGISHTRVPTESRPGHVALIAGLYEDPSAVLKGWQENPVDFDSVFNRSETTYSWGSPDVLSIFSKTNENHNIQSFAYDAAYEDFSGKKSTISLDNWVFDRVDDFFSENPTNLLNANKQIFFLHLLGMDTAGHVHKPNTKLFDDNLRAVDEGVQRIVKLFNRFFHDNKTAFIFTSDHGMTDRGSHGAGYFHETETPFISWGAGINYWPTVNRQHIRERNIIVGGKNVPRFDIEQADVASLMASLIGIAVPVNNFGKLPSIYLNCSKDYISQAMFNNALQIAEQYTFLRNAFARGAFSRYLNDFEQLNGNISNFMEKKIKNLILTRKFDEAIQLCKDYTIVALDGIDYFQTYYQHWLLFAVTLSMFGWIIYLQQLLSKQTNKFTDNFGKFNYFYLSFAAIVALVVVLFMLFQNMPISIGVFFILPILCWMPCRIQKIFDILLKLNAWFFVLAIEMLVWTFFYRSFLTVLLILLPIYYTMIAKGKVDWKWIVTTLVLSIFPSLPIVGKEDRGDELLYIGLALWTLKHFYFLIKQFNYLRLINVVIFLIASINMLFVNDGFDKKVGLTTTNQIISWICLAISFILPLLQERIERLSSIIDSLCISYIIMSLSYEPIFYFVLSLNLQFWVNVENKEISSRNLLYNSVFASNKPNENGFQRAFIVMLYVLVSFFGTGNLASISSFDPSSVRCLIGTFSPFMMAILIIIKILIPVLVVVCCCNKIQIAAKIPMEQLFIVILLICDIMGVNFLFLVKNKGSWLDIGTSISHFVIMEVTVLVLCILQVFANCMLNVKIKAPSILGHEIGGQSIKIE